MTKSLTALELERLENGFAHIDSRVGPGYAVVGADDMERLLAQARRAIELESENVRRKNYELAAVEEMAKARRKVQDLQSSLDWWRCAMYERGEETGLVKKLWDKAKELERQAKSDVARIAELETQLEEARACRRRGRVDSASITFRDDDGRLHVLRVDDEWDVTPEELERAGYVERALRWQAGELEALRALEKHTLETFHFAPTSAAKERTRELLKAVDKARG